MRIKCTNMSYVNYANGVKDKDSGNTADIALQKEAFVKLLTKFIRY